MVKYTWDVGNNTCIEFTAKVFGKSTLVINKNQIVSDNVKLKNKKPLLFTLNDGREASLTMQRSNLSGITNYELKIDN